MKRESTSAQARRDDLEETTETAGGPEFSPLPTEDLGGEQCLMDYMEHHAPEGPRVPSTAGFCTVCWRA